MRIEVKELVFGMGLLIGMIGSVGAHSAKRCTVDFSKLEYKFDATLDSQNADSVNSAMKLLGRAEPCIKTNEDRALFGDLTGELCYLLYINFKEQRDFDCALNVFKKAAALNTSRKEKIYWHIARLMKSAGRYAEGIDYLNKVLAMNPKSEDALPYLETGFQLVVDTKQWEDAKGLMEELSRRDRRFYANPELLLSSVITLCHFDQLGDARTIIKNVEEHVHLDEHGRKLLKQSKEVVKNCAAEKQQ